MSMMLCELWSLLLICYCVMYVVCITLMFWSCLVYKYGSIAWMLLLLMNCYVKCNMCKWYYMSCFVITDVWYVSDELWIVVVNHMYTMWVTWWVCVVGHVLWIKHVFGSWELCDWCLSECIKHVLVSWVLLLLVHVWV